MRLSLAAISLLALMLAPGGLVSTGFAQPTAPQEHGKQLVGRWRVKFTLSGVEKNLILDAQAKGSGVFHLLDTGPDDKPVAMPAPAAWSQLTNDRLSFSGEAELPIGTCCREIGTLIFKGRFTSPEAISGKLIFITSVEEEENPYQFRTLVGAFTATRER